MSEEQAAYGEDHIPLCLGKRISPHKAGLLHVQVPLWLLERVEVGAGAKLCYGRLALHANDKDHCWPSQETLAQELGVSRRQVIRYTNELQACGLIETEGRGLGQSQMYYFLEHPWMSPYGDRSVTTEVTDLSHIIDQRKSEDLSEEEEERPDYLAETERLYSNLPRGISSPLYAPSRWFAALRNNGSKLIEANHQVCIEFVLELGISMWKSNGYPDNDRPITLVKPEFLPQLEQAANVWKKHPPGRHFSSVIGNYLERWSEDDPAHRVPRLQPNNILMRIVEHLDVFEHLLQDPAGRVVS